METQRAEMLRCRHLPFRHMGWLCLWLFLGLCVLSVCKDSKTEFREIVDSAVKQMTPVVRALDLYEARMGKYPESFQELVVSGDLSEIPKCPEMGGNDCELRYSTDPAHSLAYLVVAFEFETWGYYLHYVSFRKKWEVTKYPPKMRQLAIESMGLRYRHSPSASNLVLAVNAIILDNQRGGASLPIYRHLVTNAMGTGISVSVPPGIGGMGLLGERYDATNQAWIAYVVLYREMTRKLMLITSEHDEDDTLAVDSIYQIRRIDGQSEEEWSLIRKFRPGM